MVSIYESFNTESLNERAPHFNISGAFSFRKFTSYYWGIVQCESINFSHLAIKCINNNCLKAALKANNTLMLLS